MSYFCFTRYFCRCLGTYHIEFIATVLNEGNLQIECRIFREDSKALNIFENISVTLCGEIRKAKKVILGKKDFHLNRS